MSIIALNKVEKSKHLNFLFSQLWLCQIANVLEYLKGQVIAKNNETLKELIGYLDFILHIPKHP